MRWLVVAAVIYCWTLGSLPAVLAKRRIPIGGIFHKDNFDSEIAFRYAIKRENMYSDKLEFVPRIKHIDPTDSYQAEKMACTLAAEGVAAIFGPSSQQASGIVASICDRLGIPHILAHWQPDVMYTSPAATDLEDAEDSGDTDEDAAELAQRQQPVLHSFTRNFFPDRLVYSEMLGKVYADFDWNGFTLIYDTPASLEQLQDVLQLHDPHSNPVTVRQLPAGAADQADYKPLLKEIQTSGETYIMLDAEPAKVMQVLKQAASLHMMQDYQRYIITSLDAHTLSFDLFKDTLANITALRMMNPNSYEVVTALQDWQQAETRAVAGRWATSGAVYADQVRTEAALFNDAVRFFCGRLREFHSMEEVVPRPMQCDVGGGGGGRSRRWDQGKHIVQYMDGRTDEGMTGRIMFNQFGQRADYYMEIVELNKDGLKQIATWDVKHGINYTRLQSDLYSQISQSLQNKTVVVAVRIGKPWLDWKPKEEGVYLQGNDRFEGYSLDLIDGIAKILHFQYRIEPVADNQYGSYNKKTKKWNGLVKELLERRADLAICDLTITYERRTAVDFTMPFMTLGISILFAKPHKEPPKLFSFMDPLSLEVWMYMMTTYLCISVVLFFAAKLAADDWENPHPCNDDPEELENLWNMHNCVWLTVGAIMQQGCDLLPKAVSTRLIVSFWWFFALIVTSSYTANLAAFLTKEQMEASINGAEDLVKQNTIKYGTLAGGSTLSFFKESNFSTYQKMWAVMEMDPSMFVQGNDEGVERVIRSKHTYAYLCESTTIEYMVERNCNLTQIGGLLDSKGYGIAMPVNSPYRTHISQTVLKMQEDGKLHRLKQKWWKINGGNESLGGGCSADSNVAASDQELGMDNVGGVFLVLVIGCAVALLIGVQELLWNIPNVAIQNKITPYEAFKMELKFALDFSKTTKPVFIEGSGSSAANSLRSDSLESGEGGHGDAGDGDDRFELAMPSRQLNRQQRSTDNMAGGSFRHLNSI